MANASTTVPDNLVWSDEFSGSAGAAPSPLKWSPFPGSTGGTEVQCYTNSTSNAALNGSGYLVISAKPQANYHCSDGTTEAYTSGRYATIYTAVAQYGRVVMRAKMPTGAGAFPAFWAMGANIATTPWPANGEIDVAEAGGGDPSVVHGSLHGPTAGTGADFMMSTRLDTGANLADQFHTYGMTWTPSGVSYDIDGYTYGTITKQQYTATGNAWVFDHPFFLIVNVAVGGGTWAGTPSPSTPWPQQMTIDYVRFYQ